MFNELKEKKWLVWILVAVGELAVLLLVFRVGEVIGVERANFNSGWAANYGRLFGEPRPGFFDESGALPPVPAFGNAGTVLSIGNGDIVIRDAGNNEKTITVSSSTPIREGLNEIMMANIPPGAQIVVIGAPDAQGQIVAHFVRVFPDEQESSSTGQ